MSAGWQRALVEGRSAGPTASALGRPMYKAGSTWLAREWSGRCRVAQGNVRGGVEKMGLGRARKRGLTMATTRTTTTTTTMMMMTMVTAAATMRGVATMTMSRRDSEKILGGMGEGERRRDMWGERRKRGWGERREQGWEKRLRG